jgi:hypothetical protein
MRLTPARRRALEAVRDGRVYYTAGAGRRVRGSQPWISGCSLTAAYRHLWRWPSGFLSEGDVALLTPEGSELLRHAEGEGR